MSLFWFCFTAGYAFPGSFVWHISDLKPSYLCSVCWHPSDRPPLRLAAGITGKHLTNIRHLAITRVGLVGLFAFSWPLKSWKFFFFQNTSWTVYGTLAKNRNLKISKCNSIIAVGFKRFFCHVITDFFQSAASFSGVNLTSWISSHQNCSIPMMSVITCQRLVL